MNTKIESHTLTGSDVFSRQQQLATAGDENASSLMDQLDAAQAALTRVEDILSNVTTTLGAVSTAVATINTVVTVNLATSIAELKALLLEVARLGKGSISIR